MLQKPGRLTEAEFRVMRRHPEAGARILGPLIDDPVILEVVRCHHEWWDGSGYPHGLAGEAIPPEARVLAVADALDAMTSSRSYRTRGRWDPAVAEVRRCAGTQFDPAVVRAFEAAIPQLLELHAGWRTVEAAAAERSLAS